MLPKPKFCSQCGAAVEARVVDGQPQQFCPTCDTRVFQNPPPMAAAVLLNERREVLLVKCKRYSETGTWCLPMDFAAPGESIANAAIRALKERAGVEARLIRLVDADSSASADPGDLLIVTFEVEKTGGQERTGEDVEKLAYFPLSRHPALSFSSNERALRICADSHLEEWMIRDSFERLQTDDAKAMLSDALVAQIRENSEELGRQWLSDVREGPATRAYARVDPDRLLERATTALSQFSRWLSGHEADEEVASFYYNIGRERRAQGFHNHEILSALVLLKSRIWMFAHSHIVWKRPIDVYRVLELNRRIVVFFDKAICQVTCGFEAENAA
jgi:ADP-ribose pyrophosphatase YjhB (NUDIX family)